MNDEEALKKILEFAETMGQTEKLSYWRPEMHDDEALKKIREYAEMMLQTEKLSYWRLRAIIKLTEELRSVPSENQASLF